MIQSVKKFEIGDRQLKVKLWAVFRHPNSPPAVSNFLEQDLSVIIGANGACRMLSKWRVAKGWVRDCVQICIGLETSRPLRDAGDGQRDKLRQKI